MATGADISCRFYDHVKGLLLRHFHVYSKLKHVVFVHYPFFLPSLKERREDIAPNIEFELQRFANVHQRQLRFHSDALEKYLQFAQSHEATWQGNFRDLTASVTRMATLANGERIGLNEVNAEIKRLQNIWNIGEHVEKQYSGLSAILTHQKIAEIDEFDRIQLEGVIEICRKSKSMADAGRRLFAVSRAERQSTNDSDRVKKYLAKFGLTWNVISQ